MKKNAKKTKNTEITAKFYFKKDGEAITKILRDSLLLLVEGEVRKICQAS